MTNPEHLSQAASNGDPIWRDKVVGHDGIAALSYEDVFLREAFSEIPSRFDKRLDLSSQVALGGPRINFPIVGAGMDTVTGSDMAIELALHGGIGEIHRNLTLDEQVEEVKKVKEKTRAVEEHPLSISQNATVEDALKLLAKAKRGYVMLHDNGSVEDGIAGMVTTRDLRFSDSDQQLYRVMVPFVYPKHVKDLKPGDRFLIYGQQGISTEQAVEMMKKHRIQKLPVLKPGTNQLVGMYTLKDIEIAQKYPHAALDKDGRLLVGAAIGAKEASIDRAKALQESGADVLFLDIAKGFSKTSETQLNRLRDRGVNLPVVLGNFSTPEGVIWAAKIGASGVKLGIGPSSVCTTRNKTGVGYPQISAAIEAREALDKLSNPPPLMLDGGVRNEGDVAVGIAAGADTVMMGTYLAGTDKTPGPVRVVDGRQVKLFRGMASRAVFDEMRDKDGESTTDSERYGKGEGRERTVPYKGPTDAALNEINVGLRSAMAYTGSWTIRELQGQLLIRVTHSGASENQRT